MLSNENVRHVASIGFMWLGYLAASWFENKATGLLDLEDLMSDVSEGLRLENVQCTAVSPSTLEEAKTR